MPLSQRRRLVVLLLLVAVVTVLLLNWSHLINAMMPRDSRPAKVHLPSSFVSQAEFQNIARELELDFPDKSAEFHHISIFRDNDLLSYEGPSTCLKCHENLHFTDSSGQKHSVDLMDNLTDSAHYRFFTRDHDNVWGFNGKKADNFAMGKVNRPCPKPGSFAMTAWAEIVVTSAGDTLSEGCGQCHIGGQYQAPLGEMMPFYKTLAVEKEAIDCLICHSAAYDMNRKQVVTDANGLARWDQDRSLRAALSVTTPSAEACLRCHQHNFGGDLYVDPAGPGYSQSLQNLGNKRPRIQHPGSKRGTPYSPTWDVHAAAGISCLECHQTQGHLMAKGTHTTTMMANDLPQVEVSCLDCHDDPPHESEELNRHLEMVACQTCHIPSLHPDNVTRRDFNTTEFEEDPGIHIYHDELKESGPGLGISYVWWNGDCTFLGNPIGDNPNGANLYTFYDAANRWPEFADFDYPGWYEDVMRPIAKSGRPSKIYPMKRFNGRQHIDLANIGPFGGMFVPYNLPDYFRSGNPDQAARLETNKSMMGMMYGWMFKFYMMDRFMSYMDIDGWDTESLKELRAGNNMEARWLPTDAMLEISHAIRLEGALNCDDCHGPNGVLDWQDLGYTDREIAELETLRPSE
jgi:hypothetical protein